MPKLHELIAVEKPRKITAQKILIEAASTFSTKESHFRGAVKLYEPLDETGIRYDGEESHIVTSVKEKLGFVNPKIASLLDIIAKKESANCSAKADVIVKDGDEEILIAKDVPVQTLVQFEKILEQVRGVYNHIPTLDPKSNWMKDDQKGEGYWKTPEVKRVKTTRITEWATIVPATTEHPAAIREIPKDIHEGNWTETKFSGMYSPSQKSDLLARVGKMIEAVKKARARANLQEVTNVNIGREVFKYIEGVA